MPSRRSSGKGGHQPCKRVLEQEGGDGSRYQQKSAVDEQAKPEAKQRYRSRVRFEGALDVPFAVQLRQSVRR